MLRLLTRSVYFWVITVVVIAVVIILGVYFFPPLVSNVRQSRQKATELSTKISEHEQFLATLATLEAKSTELDQLHEKAVLSLPEKPQPEILMLQLDGLLKSLELPQVSIEVPLTPSKTEGESAATNSQSITEFTLSGQVSFDKAKELIVKLRTLSRWNKLTGITIAKTAEATTTTLVGQVFSKPSNPKGFSGKGSFLDEATKLFNNFEPYTTIPNVTTEGTFGKNNPFTN